MKRASAKGTVAHRFGDNLRHIPEAGIIAIEMTPGQCSFYASDLIQKWHIYINCCSNITAKSQPSRQVSIVLY